MTVDAPVRYMDKSREYYAAHGYEKPYRWAHFDDVPFTRPRVPLSDATLGVVTTSMLDDAHLGRHRRLAEGDLANPPTALYTEDVFWDRDATHTRDRESYFPYAALGTAVDSGRLGRLGPRFFCVPTTYSARKTMEEDAPAIVTGFVEDAVDVALLVPL